MQAANAGVRRSGYEANNDVSPYTISSSFYLLSACLSLSQVSDGGVHSHISHLEALLVAAKQAGVPQSFVHFFSDGRDTSPVSGGECVCVCVCVCVCAQNRTQTKAIIHDFGTKFNQQQNWHLFMLITMVQIPASYLIPSPRYILVCYYCMHSVCPRPSTPPVFEDARHNKWQTSVQVANKTRPAYPWCAVAHQECCFCQFWLIVPEMAHQSPYRTGVLFLQFWHVTMCHNW